MAKDKRKLFKPVHKKDLDGIGPCFVIRYKNLAKRDISDVRRELSELCKDFWAPLPEYEEKEDDVVET